MHDTNQDTNQGLNYFNQSKNIFPVVYKSFEIISEKISSVPMGTYGAPLGSPSHWKLFPKNKKKYSKIRRRHEDTFSHRKQFKFFFNEPVEPPILFSVHSVGNVKLERFHSFSNIGGNSEHLPKNWEGCNLREEPTNRRKKMYNLKILKNMQEDSIMFVRLAQM